MLLETGNKTKTQVEVKKEFLYHSLLVRISHIVVYIPLIKTQILLQEDTKVVFIIIIYKTTLLLL